MEQPLRVAIYARVSTEEQAEYGYSIDAQLDNLKNYCQLYNKQIVDEYVDRGVSGKSMKGRYELQRLLLDAKEGRFDEVLVWKINRMARKNIDLLQIVDILDKHNIAFRSFSENFETATSMGRFALQMMGAVGELERNTIVDNVKMGHKQRAKTGRHNGKVPLGYRIVEIPGTGRGKNSQIVIVEEEAILVRKIFEMYAGGHGLRAIANSLNQQGYTTKRNNTFSSCAVRDILDNPMFVGKIRYNQYENWAEKRRKGKTENPILVQGHHPAIIADDLWEKVELLRKKKSKMPKKRFEGEYLLTGLIRCPECGAAMTASRTVNQMKDGTKVTRMYYSCGRFKSQGSSVCHANSIRKVEAEKAVTQRIQGVLTKPPLLKAIVRSINERKSNRIKPLQDELTGVKARISKLEEKKQRYLGLYEIDRIDRDLFAGRLNDLNSDLDTELVRKNKLELELRNDQTEPISYELVRSLIERFDHLLQQAPFPQRKTLLHLVVKKISLDDKRQVQDVELIFNEETQKHFLSLAPSAQSMAEGAFPIHRKAPSLKQTLNIVL
ncbi:MULTISPECIES: recombinase family protein [unclassified Paenibacillus]|uniref:recombinase family protein n=1 Tax=unclassified Paenibacillus TaxID=185978 RepID=UPI0009555C93|nr:MULTISPECIES: recombinase family protein [unclassified Paenibacillus]ASS67596.1 recombinase family protein [Paenibacillus sp. RUD330]SIQ71403.1 site-specific DNA recombinase [Paenibacillus sp. RU4X]SIQ93060.1 site-specific DNA recombinase [Paenibacillus sp. RU4T]